MSVCKGIGNGIGGAIGKWGAGLGSALGLGAAVDLGVRGYTGYGLLETLNVPYIECPDGSFATAMEWYGSGLKCPKRPESVRPKIPKNTTQQSAALDYDSMVESMGGYTISYWGASSLYTIASQKSEFFPNFTSHDDLDPRSDVPTTRKKLDDFGNFLADPDYIENVYDSGWSKGMYINNFTQILTNSGFGGWAGSIDRRFYTTKELAASGKIQLAKASGWPYTLLAMKAVMPTQEKAPPAASIPPPRGFSPNPPSPPEECEMSCPCLSPQEIEKIIKRAIGLNPFSPEKIVREMGAKMYAAPGPSVVPIVPASLVEAVAAIVATTYMRAGYGRYPVMMPSSLINEDSGADAIPTTVIENFAEWFEWFVKQQDAVQGEWPIDIAIVDGAKRQPLKFENISEALSEIAGLQIQTATDADAAVNAACTAATAAVKSTNAAIVAQKNVECLIRFFGVRTGFKSIFVQSPITPADPDDANFNLRKFLTPSGQNLAYLSDEDPFDFQAVLDRILRNTEINRASVARNIDKDGLPGDFARNQRKYDTAESRREAEKELEKLEQSIQAKNPEFRVKIKVDTPVGDSIAGNNFVIKRPKNE